jgi:hypothetical protein
MIDEQKDEIDDLREMNSALTEERDELIRRIDEQSDTHEQQLDEYKRTAFDQDSN